MNLGEGSLILDGYVISESLCYEKLTSKTTKIRVWLFDSGGIRTRVFLLAQARMLPNLYKPSVRWVQSRDPAEGPALEIFYENGRVKSREYKVKEFLHRPYSDGPAVEDFYPSGRLQRVNYIVNDQHHRPIVEGPAIEEYDSYGRSIHKSYWEKGVRLK